MLNILCRPVLSCCSLSVLSHATTSSFFSSCRFSYFFTGLPFSLFPNTHALISSWANDLIDGGTVHGSKTSTRQNTTVCTAQLFPVPIFCNKAVHHPALQIVEHVCYGTYVSVVLPRKQICCDPVLLKARSGEQFSVLTLFSVLGSLYNGSNWKDRCKMEGRQVRGTRALSLCISQKDSNEYLLLCFLAFLQLNGRDLIYLFLNVFNHYWHVLRQPKSVCYTSAWSKKSLVQKSAVLQRRNMTENLVVKLTCVICTITSAKVLTIPFQPLIWNN